MSIAVMCHEGEQMSLPNLDPKSTPSESAATRRVRAGGAAVPLADRSACAEVAGGAFPGQTSGGPEPGTPEPEARGRGILAPAVAFETRVHRIRRWCRSGIRLTDPSGARRYRVERAVADALAVHPVPLHALQTLPFGLEVLVGGSETEADAFVCFLTTELAEALGPGEWARAGSAERTMAESADLGLVAEVLTRPVWLGMTTSARRWHGYSTLDATLAPLRGGMDATGERALPIARLAAHAAGTPMEYASSVERMVELFEARARLLVPALGGGSRLRAEPAPPAETPQAWETCRGSPEASAATC